jgi:hypothetical protein
VRVYGFKEIGNVIIPNRDRTPATIVSTLTVSPHKDTSLHRRPYGNDWKWSHQHYTRDWKFGMATGRVFARF